MTFLVNTCITWCESHSTPICGAWGLVSCLVVSSSFWMLYFLDRNDNIFHHFSKKFCFYFYTTASRLHFAVLSECLFRHSFFLTVSMMCCWSVVNKWPVRMKRITAINVICSRNISSSFLLPHISDRINLFIVQSKKFSQIFWPIVTSTPYAVNYILYLLIFIICNLWILWNLP